MSEQPKRVRSTVTRLPSPGPWLHPKAFDALMLMFRGGDGSAADRNGMQDRRTTERARAARSEPPGTAA